jgi:multidrug resistance protein, MATE family
MAFARLRLAARNLPVSALRAEIRKMASLGAPVAATQLAGMLIGFVDTAMVGRVSVEALGAVALANVWIYGTIEFAAGIVMGLAPIVAQAHGAGDGERAGRALQTGVLLAALLTVPVALLWLGTENFLRLAGQQPELARMAHAYTRVQIPGIPFYLCYIALRQYLQGREHMRPALWVMIAANVVHAGLNWVLIFGHLGFAAQGIVGAGIATTLTRAGSCLGLVAYTRAFALHERAWVPWSREALARARLVQIAALGLPIALQISLEIWAFSGAALVAGRLGAVPLAAHTVTLNMAALAFMLPLGIAQGAATRVGNLIGAREPDAAQRAAWVSIGMGAAVMSFSALAFRNALPRIYTPDADVIAACAAILPIAGAFQIFDGTQAVGCGVLRGMGRTRPAMVFNLVSYWGLALPIGSWLALRRGWGLAGIWWGLACGLGLVAISLVLWIRARGPAVDRGALVWAADHARSAR